MGDAHSHPCCIGVQPRCDYTMHLLLSVYLSIVKRMILQRTFAHWNKGGLICLYYSVFGIMTTTVADFSSII